MIFICHNRGIFKPLWVHTSTFPVKKPNLAICSQSHVADIDVPMGARRPLQIVDNKCSILRVSDNDTVNNSNILKFGSDMASSTMSTTVATTIFAILASYALWESHAPFKRKQCLRRQVAYKILFTYNVFLITEQ